MKQDGGQAYGVGSAPVKEELLSDGDTDHLGASAKAWGLPFFVLCLSLCILKLEFKKRSKLVRKGRILKLSFLEKLNGGWQAIQRMIILTKN